MSHFLLCLILFSNKLSLNQLIKSCLWFAVTQKCAKYMLNIPLIYQTFTGSQCFSFYTHLRNVRDFVNTQDLCRKSSTLPLSPLLTDYSLVNCYKHATILVKNLIRHLLDKDDTLYPWRWKSFFFVKMFRGVGGPKQTFFRRGGGPNLTSKIFQKFFFLGMVLN